MWIDLSRQIRRDEPAPATHGRFEINVVRHQFGEVRGRLTYISTATHIGTHVDAASHFLPDGKDIEEYQLSQFTGPGVALDVRREGAVEITAAELESATPVVEPGDIVLLNTGHAGRTDERTVREHPYLSVDAAEWLIERKVKLVGVDVVTPDMASGSRAPGFDWPVHHILFRGGALIIENLGPGLDEVTGHRLEVVAAPVRIVGSDGAPVVPLARIVS